MRSPELILEQRTTPEPNTGCLLWTGPVNGNGYGSAWFFKPKRKVLTHRVALELKLGRPIRPGMYVCHSCDVPSCVNPDHLWEGTGKDNAQDMARKGRQNFQKRPQDRDRGDDHWSRRMPERRPYGERNGARKHPERVARGDRSAFRLHPELVRRGEDNPAAKLTEREAREILDLRRSGKTLRWIGEHYGLSESGVSLLCLGKNWPQLQAVSR